jgi:DNA-binding transcriptional LysR family regulator
MAMNLKHLRYFIAVAEEGHITRAAERLGMQQPPLSQLLKGMERELDVQLFRRRPRGVELTDAGHAFLDNARAVLAQLDQTFEVTRRTARGEQGRISVGYTNSALFHPVVPRVIREFRESLPLVSVTFAEGFVDDLIERLRSDRIDVVFIRTPVANPEGTVVDPLLKEPMVVALPNAHALARSENGGDTGLSLKALAGETFIVYSAQTLQANLLVRACQAAGFSPNIGQVVSNISSRLNLVAAGLGITLVSASMKRMNIDGVAYRRLKGSPPLRFPLNLVSRRGETSAAVRGFLKLAKQTARNYRVN